MLTTKKNVLLAACLFISLGLFAQVSIEKGYAGGTLGFSKLTGDLGDDGSGGLNIAVDGAVFLTSQFAVGVEGNFNFIGFKNEDSFVSLSFLSADLYMAKAEYYFMDKNFSPYAGLGLGLSKISTPEVTDGAGNVTLAEERRFNLAISPRVGIAIGGFHIDYIYNFAGRTPDTEQFSESINDKAFNFYTISLGYRYIFEL